MLNVKAVKVTRILNPTSIDLGEYVINPYMGCEFACLYCYVRYNKVISRKQKPWGSYVDIRINAPKLLEKELLKKKPKDVLLGSTCECFQPAESKYRITRNILEVLNRYGIYYTILTRSPDITEYIRLLSKGFLRNIYFTINNMPKTLKNILEYKSPSFKQRTDAIKQLLDNGITVTPYFSPLLPGISDIEKCFYEFSFSRTIEFEGLNFRLGNIDQIIGSIGECFPSLKSDYLAMVKDKKFYDSVWRNTEDKIIKQAKKTKKRYNIYIHNFAGYFENQYSRG